MKIFEYHLDEVSTPTGTIYIRFREKVGERTMVNGQIRNKYYLTAFAGFANAPEDLKRETALRNFSINKAEDLVNMIKTIFSDKTFISVKKVVLYDDLTNPMQGPRTPVFKRNPYLYKFFQYVEREGGDKIEVVDKVSKEGPPKLMRPRKENPMKGKKIRDIPQGETKKTVTFTVSPRFYREIQNNLPNIMRYRGPEGTFVMPNELFMAFRKQAEERFPFADIKIQQRVATGESMHEEEVKAVYCSQCGKGFSPKGAKYKTGFSHCVDHKGMKAIVSENLNEGSDKDPHERGIADGYYGRKPDPHKYVAGVRVKLTDPEEIKQYMAGYNDDSYGSKVYEGGIDMDPEPDHEASMAKGELYNTIKNAKELFDIIQDGENLEGWVASKITKAADYINTVHDYLMYEKQYNESVTDESGPASRALCRSKKPDGALGASNLASCISQGLRAHKSGRADYVSGKQLRVGGKKIKGKKYGGPLPDYS